MYIYILFFRWRTLHLFLLNFILSYIGHVYGKHLQPRQISSLPLFLLRSEFVPDLLIGTIENLLISVSIHLYYIFIDSFSGIFCLNRRSDMNFSFSFKKRYFSMHFYSSFCLSQCLNIFMTPTR